MEPPLLRQPEWHTKMALALISSVTPRKPSFPKGFRLTRINLTRFPIRMEREMALGRCFGRRIGEIAEEMCTLGTGGESGSL